MSHLITHKTNIIHTEAIFSDCEKYRYSLSRKVEGKPGKVTYIMFNPNMRDDIQLGITSNYCFNYTMKLGFGEMEIVNLFALRTKSIRDLKNMVKMRRDPIGVENDQYIKRSIEKANMVIVARGSSGGYLKREKTVLDIIKDSNLYCFGKTKVKKPIYPRRSMETDLKPYL
ncbi:DUF1643 domain-containing protein [Bacillus infantis]|uniref:DUF1643 domain-containing protein n=1 Tax=Bacillus infantis TaxID=324767 RepID=UPI0020A1EB4A|nr:DUF1643 domain-containing protein [Bacillus infantis]MCP1161317.1 DUF1643 domain-containing protein [Bacillus infantis]